MKKVDFAYDIAEYEMFFYSHLSEYGKPASL